MCHGLSRCDSVCRVAPEHLIEQVKTQFIDWHFLVQWLWWVVLHLSHVLFIQGELSQAWPLIKGWGASDHENFGKLVSVVEACEQGLSVDNFREDAPN